MGQPQRTRKRSTVGVVTVDDQAVFREVAREVIEATDGFESLGEACSGEDALQLADDVDPDLVLVDVRMPGMNGVETASRLAAAHPTATIVLVSSEDRTALPADAERCGASGAPLQGGVRDRRAQTAVGHPWPWRFSVRYPMIIRSG